MNLGRSGSGATNLAVGDNTQLSLVSRVVSRKGLRQRNWFPSRWQQKQNMGRQYGRIWAIGQHQNQSNLSAGS